MFSAEEQPLLTGNDDAIDEFVDADRCMVIDWRGTEDEAIDDAIRFLPEGVLTYETTFPEDDTIAIRVSFRGRVENILFPFQPQNNFRVLLRVWRLLQPDYDIKLFRCTDRSDTQSFLLRPTEWWTTYRNAYPQQYQKVFRDITDLNELWELNVSKSTSVAAAASS
jgi:hypothetical protein